jgi:hypothetical protein
MADQLEDDIKTILSITDGEWTDVLGAGRDIDSLLTTEEVQCTQRGFKRLSNSWLGLGATN